MVEQFHLTNRLDPISFYQSRSEWTWELRKWRGITDSWKLQEWSLTIRCIFVSYLGLPLVLSLWRDAVGVFYSLVDRVYCCGFDTHGWVLREGKSLMRIFFSPLNGHINKPVVHCNHRHVMHNMSAWLYRECFTKYITSRTVQCIII